MITHKVTTLDGYLNLDIRRIENEFKHRSEKEWQEESQNEALRLFKEAAKRVPAYKKFLKEHEVNPSSIKTYSDFQLVPYTDKKNYIDKYPLSELVWDGKVANSLFINASSGSTGKPYYWPGAMDQVVQGSIIKEMIYKNNFQLDTKSTLLIISFGMGTWIAGLFTFLTSQLVSQKQYPLTIITPGFQKEETLRILEELSPQFDQTIIAGLPTFVKDLLDRWKRHKKAKEIKLKFLFAGEGISESFRSYILELSHNDDYYNSVINIYGSADTAINGFESSLSIALRKNAVEQEALKKDLFLDDRIPSVYSYIPTSRFFEIEKNELILTANRGIPLIRYNIHDQGGILTASHIKSVLKKYHISVDVTSNTPLLYIFGRGKFAATLYAANIYPEFIREIVVDRAIREYLTGKFTLATKYTNKQDHYLEVNLELAEDVIGDEALVEQITEVFITKLKKLSTEYSRIYQEYGIKAKPKIILREYGDPELFPRGKVKKSG